MQQVTKGRKERVRSSEGFLLIPLTYTHGPRCDDPTGDTEDQQDCAGANGHQGLHHKTGVKVDLVECPDAAGGSVCEQFAVKQHDPSNQVEPQEHGHREDDVNIRIRYRCCVAEGQSSCPGEHVLAWDWMDGTDQKLQHNKENPLKGHSYSPIICPVVHHEEL